MDETPKMEVYKVSYTTFHWEDKTAVLAADSPEQAEALVKEWARNFKAVTACIRFLDEPEILVHDESQVKTDEEVLGDPD